MAGSGYVKPENPALEIENNCALAALMAAREAQDAAFNKAWVAEENEKSEVLDISEAPVITATEQTLPPPVFTTPLSETCFLVDGHTYKIPDVERAREIQKSLEALEAQRQKEEATWATYWKTPPETKTETNTDELPHLEAEEL